MRILTCLAFLGALAAAVVAALLLPDVNPGRPWDKLLHAAGFGVLGLLGSMAAPDVRARAWLGLGLLAFGIAIELVQAALPMRSASLNDIIADAAGILAGLALAAAMITRMPTWLGARGATTVSDSP